MRLLTYAVQKTQLEIITHNFLESGHSYMECDSMHSAIETEKKYIAVYTIIDWMSVSAEQGVDIRTLL